MKNVAKRTARSVFIAVFCTTIAIILLTLFEILPRERFVHEILISAAITVVVTSIVAPIVFWNIFKLVDQLSAAKIELSLQAERDFLTKLANRRGLQAKARWVIDKAKLEKQPISMIILDIDNFKKVNDTYGHQVGDLVIVAAAQAILDIVERLDNNDAYAGRIGGEEYAIILRGVTRRALTDLVEQLRVACESKAVVFGDIEISFTVSIGSTVSGSDDAEYEHLIKIADKALYRAKKTGRNCCTFVEYGVDQAAA